ncbi:MAG: hypothetical protein ACPG4T_02670 [Nannocystaceae bacterium]
MIRTEHHEGISGQLTMTVCARSGEVLARQVAPNLITLAGKRLLARLLTGGIDGRIELSMVVGAGSRAPAVTDTALEEPVEEVPAQLDQIEDVGKAVRIRVRATLPQRDQKKVLQLREAGILVRALSSSGREGKPWPLLFNRVTFDVLSRNNRTSIMLAWDITL